MKKKIKDLTKEEIDTICDKYNDNCDIEGILDTCNQHEKEEYDL